MWESELFSVYAKSIRFRFDEMKKKKQRRWGLYTILLIVVCFSAFLIWQMTKKVQTAADWQEVSKVQSIAEFNGDFVTVKNIRNFQYDASGTPTVENYYDKTYDLRTLKKVWYIVVPFDAGSPFAHTFMSFEFSDGSYLAITIEARLRKDQQYNDYNGVLHTFPLIYIAADERDAIYMRANLHKDDVYLYPVNATPEQGRLLFVDMLRRMNDLVAHPDWYNSIWDNCTSSIANHINKIWPGTLPKYDWQFLFTSYADQLALDKGLLGTKLPLGEARKKFYITDVAQKVGYVSNYSALLRQFK